MKTIRDRLLPEFDQEMKVTRRVLERVPDDDPEWKPHPKSFSIAHLAQLVAWMPGWIAQALHNDALDLRKAGSYSNEKTASLLEMFDRNVRESRTAIENAQDADYENEWSLKMGEQVMFTDSKYNVVRQNISHLSHHRGQLTVYLRLLDVPVPSIYGPTADEGWGG